MKKYYVFLSIVLLMGCKKENKNPSPSPSGTASVSIVNLWELQKNLSYTNTNGTITNGDTSYAAPNDFWFRFSSNYTYKEYENTIVTDSGTYTFSNGILNFINTGDTAKYTAILNQTTLNLFFTEIDFNFPDTVKFENQLTFKKI